MGLRSFVKLVIALEEREPGAGIDDDAPQRFRP